MTRLPRPHLLLAILAALVLLLTTACSDAPTEKEIAMADDGVDPSIVPIFVAEELLPAVTELGTIFLIDHPGVTFQYTAKDAATLTQRIGEGKRPALWIDLKEVLGPFDEDPSIVGERVPVGRDVVQFIVLKTYQGKLPTLEAFGPGDFPVDSGLCDAAVPCGRAAREVLAEAGVTPEPDVVLPTGKEIVVALADGQFQTALVYRSEAAGLYTKFGTIALPDPEIASRTYESLRMRPDAVAEAFQQWIATSPDAEPILVKHGLRPRPGARA